MRIDGYTVPAAPPQNHPAEILNRLNPGDTLRAQVLENSGSELTLKLTDGTKISAAALSPVDAKEGEFVNFVFKGTVEGKPVLEVLNRTAQFQPDQALEGIKILLSELKLPLTDKNIMLALALKEQDMPVTAGNMEKVAGLIGKNDGLRPDTAAFLTASNLSADANNIAKLQSLLAGRLKIGNDLAELFKLAGSQNNSGAAVDAAADTTIDTAVVNRLLERLAGEQSGNKAASPAGGQNNSGNGTGPGTDRIVANGSLPGTGADGTGGQKAAAAAAGTITINSGQNETENQQQVPSAPKEFTGDGRQKVPDAGGRVPDTVKPAPEKAAGEPGSIPEKLAELLNGGKPLGRNELQLLYSLKSRVETLGGRGGDGLPVPEVEAAAIRLIAREINALLLKSGGRAEEAEPEEAANPARRFFQEEAGKLKALIIKVDQNNSDEINPVRLYHEIDKSLQALKSSMQLLPAQMRETAANIVGNLESNINFINQLNSYSSYVQLPLSIFSQNTTGELYMLKKGSKARKLDPSNMTVLISLDSGNIGRIDTLLSVDKKNISTNFRLEKSDVFEVMRDKHRELYKGLLEKGFRLVDFTYRLMEEPVNIVNFETEAKKEFIKSPNNIDVVI